MAVRPWDKPIQASRTLTAFKGAGFSGGGWAPIFDLAVQSFNDLMKANSLNVTITASDSDKANIIVNTASKQASFSFEGADYSKAFDGEGLHGSMVPVADGGSGLVVKAFIFVPASPKADKAKKNSREVGQEVRRFILTHELIHAAGLSNDEHTLDDLMCYPAEISVGSSAADDRLQPWGGLGKQMPPYYISSKTATNIKKAWP